MKYCAASVCVCVCVCVCAGFLKNRQGVITNFHFEQTEEEDHCLCTELQHQRCEKHEIIAQGAECLLFMVAH